MKNKHKVLVIEDTPEFMDVARSVYDKDSRISPVYTTNFEDAMEELNTNTIDGVVSDLFFPSKTNWRKKLLDSTGYEEVEFLLEKPSGIGIMEYCYDNKLACVILSQGCRHDGDYDVVNKALARHPIREKIDWNLIQLYFVDSGNWIDKNDPQSWKIALNGGGDSRLFKNLIKQINKGEGIAREIGYFDRFD